MPLIKIFVDGDEYTLQCEVGEESELNKAVEIVNEKMKVFGEQSNINKKTRLLMVSLLLASEYNETKIINTKQSSVIKEIDGLLEKIESKL